MKSIIAVTALFVAASEYCQDVCDGHTACAESKYGSYCKDNGVCFGLYHNGNGYCFQPTEQDACEDFTLHPVTCSNPKATCQDICNDMPQCRDSKWSSYCKLWQKPPVCFGIIKKADGTLCFTPTDEDCEGESLTC
ncbi:hypothetical protein Pmar_PMAR011508 [Perkinsus marinus ATCC 50983]|uniref:Uncharacterized protein n=1 Tax=Perkinsus marinus (strain ATCC 50983 / TXsc) TaxID=423536 RepID=C5LC01_PERM5|nr:hypothetical protein Pmar_PMAR011508 [Perkinsus marinus ATCC 50983]EER05484.1 hypothetical protein Pmar_PMAR011508 [Perkinsus marinus ATCC 50983]|eukprot:XP_002773668.1 hypothetical protein Pmar_PMAR011508 [Perkinsus marinus ATCC 50983]